MQLTTTPSLNAMWTAILALLNSGTIEFLNSSGSVLVTIPLSATAGTVSSGVASLAGFPKSVSAAAIGTIATARLRSGGSTPATVASLKVGATGETEDPSDPFDVVISTRTVEQVGQVVQVTNTPTLTFVAG